SLSDAERQMVTSALSSPDYTTWYQAEVKRQANELVQQGYEPAAANQRAQNLVGRGAIGTAFNDALNVERITWTQSHQQQAQQAYALGYLNASDQNTALSGVLPTPGAPTTPAAVTTTTLVDEFKAGATYAELSSKYGLTEEAIRSRIRRATGTDSPSSLRTGQ
ncbi:MAG: hypothetical protein IT345_10495, partial [Trueperaceae bacterium]|nr:hypothetical protein [Trueperaceae bacterium]